MITRWLLVALLTFVPSLGTPTVSGVEVPEQPYLTAATLAGTGA